MPELPEVETIKLDLNKKILGLKIEEVDIYDQRVLKDLIPRKFIQAVKGKKIKAVERRGKAIIVEFKEGGFLIVQPKMTGQLIYGEDLKKTQNLKETKVIFKLSNGQYLNYNDQRLFGKLSVVKKLEDSKFIKSLGPEPLENAFTLDWLSANIKRFKSPIKTLLMNQAFIAGIGNIYASEILFKAGINPKKKAAHLKEEEIKFLYKATVEILKKAVSLRGTSFRDYRDADGKKGNYLNELKVYGRENEPCHICRRPLVRIAQSGRSTFHCEICQK